MHPTAWRRLALEALAYEYRGLGGFGRATAIYTQLSRSRPMQQGGITSGMPPGSWQRAC
jgi:hypothetical protein